MVPAQLKDIPTERKVFGEAWQLLTQYYYLTADDESGWDALWNRANEICEAMKGNPPAFELSREIIIAVMRYLETLQKTRQPTAGTVPN